MSTDGSQLGYAELLRLAGSKGLQELDIQITQVPDEANAGHAVVVASARTSGALYRAVGEAWQDELPAAQRFQVLTVAERRAKVRVLCEAVGMPQPTDAGGDAAGERSASGREPAPGPAPRAVMESRASLDLRSAAQREPVQGAYAAPVREQANAPSGSTHEGTPRTSGPPRQAEPPAPRQAAPDPPAARSTSGAPARGVAPRPATEPPAAEHARSDARPDQPRPAAQAVTPEPLGPDIFQQLMRMMHQKGELDGEQLTDEEAHARLDSFFQRAFNHPIEEGTRVEGKQTIQRLASVISRLKQERAEGPASAAS